MDATGARMPRFNDGSLPAAKLATQRSNLVFDCAPAGTSKGIRRRPNLGAFGVRNIDRDPGPFRH